MVILLKCRRKKARFFKILLIVRLVFSIVTIDFICDIDLYSVQHLHSNCMAFFGAGSETVKTTTEWCLLTAAHYSDYQKKVQVEIDGVVGKDRAVTYADRLRMPFTQAFISEIYRWKPTVPINLYRRYNQFITYSFVKSNLQCIHCV